MARKATKQAGPTPVDSITHDDKRTNIPTADAHAFVDPAIEEVRKVRYARDESLDPQLVWRGKYPPADEIGEADVDLVTDAPPIYIQEKIDPRVLIENLRRTAERPEDEPELTLFESFDGLGELDQVDFYKHDANWSNRMILGDSLQVMASLAEREKLRGKVQMVYIDPPYGIKFGSNWQVSARNRDVKDGKRRGRRSRGRADQGLPRHLGARHPLLPGVPAGPAARGARAADRVRIVLRPDRRRERAPRPQHSWTRCSAATTSSAQIAFARRLVSHDADVISRSVTTTSLWYAKDRESVKFRQLFATKRRERTIGANVHVA